MSSDPELGGNRRLRPRNTSGVEPGLGGQALVDYVFAEMNGEITHGEWDEINWELLQRGVERLAGVDEALLPSVVERILGLPIPDQGDLVSAESKDDLLLLFGAFTPSVEAKNLVLEKVTLAGPKAMVELGNSDADTLSWVGAVAVGIVDGEMREGMVPQAQVDLILKSLKMIEPFAFADLRTNALGVLERLELERDWTFEGMVASEHDKVFAVLKWLVGKSDDSRVVNEGRRLFTRIVQHYQAVDERLLGRTDASLRLLSLLEYGGVLPDEATVLMVLNAVGKNVYFPYEGRWDVFVMTDRGNLLRSLGEVRRKYTQMPQVKVLASEYIASLEKGR